MSILDSLAPRVGGVVHGDRVVVAGGFVYCSFTGKVRLDRPGRVVATLGSLVDGVESLASAYRAAVGGGQVAS